MWLLRRKNPTPGTPWASCYFAGHSTNIWVHRTDVVRMAGKRDEIIDTGVFDVWGSCFLYGPTSCCTRTEKIYRQRYPVISQPPGRTRWDGAGASADGNVDRGDTYVKLNGRRNNYCVVLGSLITMAHAWPCRVDAASAHAARSRPVSLIVCASETSRWQLWLHSCNWCCFRWHHRAALRY